MGYLTLKSRVSFPNSGCGTELFPIVDRRPAVSTCKEPSQLGLLTVDIPSRRGWGLLLDLYLSTQPTLPDGCMQFCPNGTWPWGLREGLGYIGWEKSKQDAVSLM